MTCYMILICWYKRYRAQIPCRDSLCGCVYVCVPARTRAPVCLLPTTSTVWLQKVSTTLFKEGLTVQRLRNVLFLSHHHTLH